MLPTYGYLIIFGVELILLFLYVKFIVNGKLSIYEPGKINDKDMLKRLFVYMKPYLKRYALAIVLMTIMVVMQIFQPFIMMNIMKEAKSDNINFNVIVEWFVLGIIAVIILNVLYYFEPLLLHYTGQKITYQIRADVFEHIQKLSHEQFNQIPVGTLVTRNTSDVNVLFELYTNVIVNLLKYVVTIIGYLIAMFILNVNLALIVLDIFPLILALTLTFRTFLRRVHRTVRNETSAMNAFLSENISGIKTTQIFNQEPKKYNEFKEVNGRLRKANIREIFTFGIFRPSIYLVYISTIILVVYSGASSAIEAGFLACILYVELNNFYELVGQFFNPIQNLAEQYNQLQSAYAAAEKIFNVLNIVPDIEDSEDAIDIDLKGYIEFKDVWFSYNNHDWILKGVSFKIEPKDVVAFVGATGAGKSTILGLITRNYDIQKGEILIDGLPIKKIKVSSLRGQIGQMLQDVFLFSGTIAENVRLDNPDITDEDVTKALSDVNADAFIEQCDNGIYQVVSERGNNLSLGERQLISFARVLVHKPKLMILDEATSNIDTETEILIQKSLDKVIENNTMIMVAHRLSTIQHANKIYVFDHGTIIESGNHQELLKQKGRYYQLYKLQYEKEQLIKNS